MKKQPTESDFKALLIAGWLAKFDATFSTFGKGLEERPGIFDAWEEATQALSIEELKYAFDEWNRTGRRFPSPGDIHSIIETRRAAQDQLEADNAWYEIRWRLTFFSWDPDNGYLPLFVGAECKLTERVAAATDAKPYNGGFLLNPKPLPARTVHAIEAVGGLRRIAELPAGSGFDFCKKAFIEAYRSPVVERIQIGKGEAKALLEMIEKGETE